MRLATTLLTVTAAFGLVSCGPGRDTPPYMIFTDMKIQPKYKAQQESPFFSGDHRASRKPVEGTVSRENYFEDPGYHFGIVNEQFIGKNPIVIDAKLLAHGQRKYDIYCAPCHDRTAFGKGIVGQRAGAVFQPANLQDPRIKAYNDGELYSVASEGRRTMMGYRNQTSDFDRWAIVAYLRALQRATSGTMEEVPENMRAEVK